MSLLPVGISGEEAGYQIERSLRFNSADSAQLSRSFGTPTNNKIFTISAWVKTTSPSATFLDFALLAIGDAGIIGIAGSGAFGATVVNRVFIRNGGSTGDYWLPLLRDVSAWYHLVIAIDTTQATQADRAKLYINGVSQASNKGASTLALNATMSVNAASTTHYIGGRNAAGYYANGYLTEYNFIDGQALTPTSFGEYNEDTGVWQPKAYTGSYGTNGFYLNFSDNSGTTSTTLGKDQAGSNNWTPNNFSVTAGAGNDSLVDTPTNYGTDTGLGGEVRGNYATWNGVSIGADATLTNGNLDIAYGSSVTRNATMGTFGMSSGKWYWEVTITASSASPTAAVIGITNEPSAPAVTAYPGFAANGWGYVGDGDKYNNGSGTAYGATFAANDVIGFAFDADAGSITAYKNGVSQGVMFSGLAANTYYPAIGDGSGASTFSASTNFGQRPFAYTAPSGFKALCTQNLPEPTVVDGSQYMDVSLYNGSATTPIVVTNSGSMQPDFVWVKRTDTAEGHSLFDSVRGVTKVLVSNVSEAEGTNSAGSGLVSFNSNGFSIGTQNTSIGGSNAGAGSTYVGWQWKANGAGVSNTDGTITSTVSANTDSGFSIVTYTGTGSAATIGHGLGAVPRMIIVKNRDAADAWQVYHAANTANPETDYLVLNTTAATADAADRWNDTLPTSTVFSIGDGVEVNTNTEDYVAYVFAAIPGYSAFGSYTGNGSADGPMVYTGFRPAFVLVKCSSAAESWIIVDSARDPTNDGTQARLFPDTSGADNTTEVFDFLSNGFKNRRGGAATPNVSGRTYIYAAFASNPFKYSLAY